MLLHVIEMAFALWLGITLAGLTAAVLAAFINPKIRALGWRRIIWIAIVGLWFDETA